MNSGPPSKDVREATVVATGMGSSAAVGTGGSAAVGTGDLDSRTSWPHFERIFMVSALTGDGMDDLKVS